MSGQSRHQELLLPGLDGANPLAFLAALGTLRTLTLAWPSGRVRLQWRRAGGGWRPVLSRGDGNLEMSSLLDTLHQWLAAPPDFRAFTLHPSPNAEPEEWAPKLRIPLEQYRELAQATVADASAAERYGAEFAGAWACEPHEVGGSVRDTTFQFTAGQQKFLEMVREIVAGTTREHLEAALFHPWEYKDPGPSLRWDPLDENRRYALQAFDPTNSKENPIVAVRGANRLAIEALPLFPIILVGRRRETTGFSEIAGRPAWTWPIWERPISLDLARSLLAHQALRQPIPERGALAALGVREIFRSFVVRPSGRYRNFTPSEAV